MQRLFFSDINPGHEQIRDNDAPDRTYPGTRIPGWPSCCTLNRLAVFCCAASVTLTAAGITAITLISNSEVSSGVKAGVIVAGAIAILGSCYCCNYAIGTKCMDKQIEGIHEIRPELTTLLSQAQTNMVAATRESSV